MFGTHSLSRGPETRAYRYRYRRKANGLSHRETVRRLKRYLARRLYRILLRYLAALTSPSIGVRNAEFE
jgi:hypothetical protein